MGYTVLAWRFDSDLSLAAMLSRINAAWREPWQEGDSDHKDYIAGALTEHTVGRVYRATGHYVAHVKHYAKGKVDQTQIAAGERAMTAVLLRLIDARRVARSEPFE